MFCLVLVLEIVLASVCGFGIDQKFFFSGIHNLVVQFVRFYELVELFGMLVIGLFARC